MREQIQMNPVYQREGDIWTPEKREMLIDTVINGFDVPKIYMHKFTTPLEKDGATFEYAVIDGKQRLKTIWDFIRGRFALAEEFEYFKDPKVQLRKLTYADLARDFPEIKTDFDSYKLDIVTIETNDIELIEDMFSRLNEAVTLNAAEKRNARGGLLPIAVREISERPFFKQKLPFSNKRYRHYDLIAKMLLIANRDSISDTKKAYLDKFFELHATSGSDVVSPIRHIVEATTDAMNKIFVDSDPLLRSVGMVVLYYIMFKRACEKGLVPLITRPKLDAFEEARKDNRTTAEESISKADYHLLEFDRYTQSPNDGIAMRFRLSVIDGKVFEGKLGFVDASENSEVD